MILQDFEKEYQSTGLISPRDTILVACSGGPDSTALFYSLEALRQKVGFKLGLAHFNHGLRGKAAKADELFVARMARRCKVPFFSGRGNIKGAARQNKFSLEEAARHGRYEFLCKTAARYQFTKVATAHTLDDQAETVMMRILQGTGLRGLCAIRPKAIFNKIIFVRPLLGISKKQILEFLRINKIAYRTDLSNQTDIYLRNKIRNQLLPWLAKEFNPKAAQALARIPAILNVENQFLEELESRAWKRTFLRKSGKSISLSRARFLKLSEALQFRILERGLKALNKASGLSFDAWTLIRQGLAKEAFRHSLPKDIDFDLTPRNLRIYEKKRRKSVAKTRL